MMDVENFDEIDDEIDDKMNSSCSRNMDQDDELIDWVYDDDLESHMMYSLNSYLHGYSFLVGSLDTFYPELL